MLNFFISIQGEIYDGKQHIQIFLMREHLKSIA